MSETANPGGSAEDTWDQVDWEETHWFAVSSRNGTNRRLHRVDGNPGPDELTQGETVEVPCDTSLIDPESYFRSKPVAVYPPGYAPLCQDEECFGTVEE